MRTALAAPRDECSRVTIGRLSGMEAIEVIQTLQAQAREVRICPAAPLRHPELLPIRPRESVPKSVIAHAPLLRGHFGETFLQVGDENFFRRLLQIACREQQFVSHRPL